LLVQMLESFLNFNEINRRPYLAFFWAFAILVVSVIIALQVGFTMSVAGNQVNLTGVFALAFSLISSAYVMTALIRKEELMEEKAIKRHYGKKFWGRHQKDVLIFMYFFGGATFAFAVLTLMLPVSTFQVQISSICAMRPYLSACEDAGIVGPVSGNAAGDGSYAFGVILTNNLQVAFFSFIFAFIFGAGAVFVILWNAGILGIYIGLMSKHIAEIPMISIRFIPHGVPEIAGYICAGLAGSLISTAILRKADPEVLKVVTVDSLKVMALGFAFIFIGAFVEVYL
jgi:uncharacterized membrane protein SpoIIM required for sporulation